VNESPKFKAVSLTEFQDVLLSGETWESLLTATVSSLQKPDEGRRRTEDHGPWGIKKLL
jgi:hypothetical protein